MESKLPPAGQAGMNREVSIIEASRRVHDV